MSKSGVYRKAPGRAANWVSRQSTWIGPDHLLAVSAALGNENYRRFSFKDIQALSLAHTAHRLYWNIFFGVVCGIASALAVTFLILSAQEGSIMSSFMAGLGIFFALVGVFSFLFLIWNSLRGPTCLIGIQTAAGVETLDTPTRISAARRFLADLIPLIQSAQHQPTASTPTTEPALGSELPSA